MQAAHVADERERGVGVEEGGGGGGTRQQSRLPPKHTPLQSTSESGTWPDAPPEHRPHLSVKAGPRKTPAQSTGSGTLMLGGPHTPVVEQTAVASTGEQPHEPPYVKVKPAATRKVTLPPPSPSARG